MRDKFKDGLDPSYAYISEFGSGIIICLNEKEPEVRAAFDAMTDDDLTAVEAAGGEYIEPGWVM
jgi:hypothetical protein